MPKYTVYDSNGDIQSYGSTYMDIEDFPLEEGLFIVEGKYDPELYYIDAGVPTLKQDYSINALPLPCTLTIEGVEYQCTEQPVFEFNYPGTYKIQVDAGVRYLKKEFNFDYQP